MIVNFILFKYKDKFSSLIRVHLNVQFVMKIHNIIKSIIFYKINNIMNKKVNNKNKHNLKTFKMKIRKNKIV
jgi:hypothetical protein